MPTIKPESQTNDTIHAGPQHDPLPPRLRTFKSAVGAAGDTSFFSVEAVTGLIVGLGSIVIAVPWTVTRLPDASVLLLLPTVLFVGYGLVVLLRRPRRTGAGARLATDVRRVRKRTLGWGLITLGSIAVPTDWVLPLFVSGWATLLYAIWQIRNLLRNRKRELAWRTSTSAEPGTIDLWSPATETRTATGSTWAPNGAGLGSGCGSPFVGGTVDV